MKEIRFDDIEALQAQVGPEFGPWGPEVEVSQEMIHQFADLTGDHQWIHVDVEKCRELSPFGAPIAHGFLTLVLLPRLQLAEEQQPMRLVGFGNIVNYGSNKLRFTGPVPAGSKIHMRSRLARVEAKPKGTQLTLEMHIHVVGSERPAVIYELIMLYQPPLA